MKYMTCYDLDSMPVLDRLGANKKLARFRIHERVVALIEILKREYGERHDRVLVKINDVKVELIPFMKTIHFVVEYEIFLLDPCEKICLAREQKEAFFLLVDNGEDLVPLPVSTSLTPEYLRDANEKFQSLDISEFKET